MGNETIFDVFPLVDYTYLKIDRTGVDGLTITDRYSAQGVFKLRSGMARNNNQETINQNPTLHIRPTETFITGELVGNGVIVNGTDYEITGQTNGVNFETGELEHITLTLTQGDFNDDSI